MKTNGPRIILIRGLLLVILSLYFMVVFGQSPTLVSFDASRKEENIALKWELAPANRLSTVIIERRTTDTAFQMIAEFWVNFDGNTERNFHYTDKKVKSSSVQYRLKFIAADGKVEYSPVVHSGMSRELVKFRAIKSKNRPNSGKTMLASVRPDSEQLKYLLLVELQEKENNLL